MSFRVCISLVCAAFLFVQSLVGQETDGLSAVSLPVEERSWEGASGAQESIDQTMPKDKDSIADQIGELRKQWEEFKKANAKKKSPVTVKVIGRIHADYWGFPNSTGGVNFFENPTTGVDPEDRILFRRLRIGVQGDIFETMLYKLEMEFANPNNPTIKDAYLGFKELPILQTVLIGNQKRPLGLDHWNSSRYNVFMERPLVVEAFNQDARRLGIASYGYNEAETMNWQFGIYALEDTQGNGSYIGDALQLSFNNRLVVIPWYDETSGGRGYLHLAIANMVADPNGNPDPGDADANEARFRTRPELRTTNRWLNTGRIANADWFDVLAFEYMLNIGAFSVVAEYQNAWVTRKGAANPSLFFPGWYVYVAYFLTGEHQPYDRRKGALARLKPFEDFFLVRCCDGSRGTGWGAWQIAVRFSNLNLSDNDILGGRENNVTFAVNWWWNDHARLQFNYVLGDIRNHAPVGGFTAGSFSGLGFRAMVDF
ncbi:MAG: ATPase [Gemmatales bacterium]|nr:MAG: ATPase [Gemmatales bacterium]